MINILSSVGASRSKTVGISSSLSWIYGVDVNTFNIPRENVSFSISENVNPNNATYSLNLFNLNDELTGTSSNKTANFNIAKNGFYGLDLTVSSNNIVNRYYPKLVKVKRPIFSEGEADLVLDLDALQAGTFSNPIGDATLSGNGTQVILYNFNEVERAGFKIYLKGNFNGRVTFQGLVGTTDDYVHIQCQTSGQNVLTSDEATYKNALTFTSFNRYIEIDGSASSTHKYGIKLNGYVNDDDNNSQIFFFQGSRQRGFYIHGVEVDGRRVMPLRSVTARASSTGNINILNPATSTFDGISFSNGDKLFLRFQTNEAENGVWDFNGSSSALTRSTDFDNWNSEIYRTLVRVSVGTTYASTAYFCNVESGGTLNTTPIKFIRAGGAAVQWNPPTPNETQNGGNYSQGPIIVHDCYIHNVHGEGMYIGYFSNALQSGYRPDRMGDVYLFDNIIENTFRDGIQLSSSNYAEIFRNIIRNVGNEYDSNHCSAISWNDGNVNGFIFQNYVEDVDLFLAGQNGSDSGLTGNYYIYSNLGMQRDNTLIATPSQFLYLAVEGAVCNYHIFNNTFISPAVTNAPITIQHNNVGVFDSQSFTFAGNVLLTSGSDQSIWPELRRIFTPADTSNWLVDNVWRRIADEGELFIDENNNYELSSIESPAFGEGFDWEGRFSGVTFPSKVNRDRLGYNLNVNNNLGYTAGCDSGFSLWVNDMISPTIISSGITGVALDNFTLDVELSEVSRVYYVIDFSGSSTPSNSQIVNGLNSNNISAPVSGSVVGRNISQLISGLTANTSYDIYFVAVDGSNNSSQVGMLKNQSTINFNPISVFVDVGSTYETTTYNSNTYNNMTTFNTGTTYPASGSFKNTSNVDSGVTIDVISTLNGSGTGTIGDQGSNAEGGGHPASVWRDYHSGGNTSVAEFRVNLPENVSFVDLKLSGSRAVSAGDTNRRIQVRATNNGVYSSWVEVNCAANTTLFAEINDLVPVGNEITVQVRASQVGTTSSFSYIGIIELHLS